VLDKKLSSIDGALRVQNIFGKPIRKSEKLDSLIYSIDSILKIDPYVRGTAIIRSGKFNEGIIIEGVDRIQNTEYFDIKRETIDYNNIILGKSLGNNMGVNIGDQVIISAITNQKNNLINQKFNLIEVVGFVESGMKEYDESIAYISIDRAKDIFKMDDTVTGYIINSSQKIERIKMLLNNQIKYPYYFETWRDRHQIIFEWIRIQRFPIVIIFSLISLVAITNIMAAVSMIIREKHSQIGILFSLGMTSSEIRKIFYFYGGIIGVLGCSLGSLASYLFIVVQNKYRILSLPEDIYFMNYIPADFDFFVFSNVFFLTLIISIISTILPTKTFEKRFPSQLLLSE
tara:strand:- start:101 stop:1132 length:1032 start_codon:yes stop_codon:yes gene_type:complete